VTYLEQRFSPLESTFLEVLESQETNTLYLGETPAVRNSWALQKFGPSRLRRRHSIGGYIPHGLRSLQSPKTPVVQRNCPCVVDRGVCEKEAGKAARDWPDTDDDSDDQDSSARTPPPSEPPLASDSCVQGPAQEEDLPLKGRQVRPRPLQNELQERHNHASAAGKRNVVQLRLASFVCDSPSQSTPRSGSSHRASPVPSVSNLDQNGANKIRRASADQPSHLNACAAQVAEPVQPPCAKAQAQKTKPLPKVAPTAATSPPPSAKPITTLMVRNLPGALPQDDLLAKLDEAGFEGLYDFVYMPKSFDELEGKGYAFVNFSDTVVASAFLGAWHKTRPWGDRCAQSLNISPADVQGLEANMKKWDGPRMSRIRNPRHRPFVRGESSGSSVSQTQDIPSKKESCNSSRSSTAKQVSTSKEPPGSSRSSATQETKAPLSKRSLAAGNAAASSRLHGVRNEAAPPHRGPHLAQHLQSRTSAASRR